MVRKEMMLSESEKMKVKNWRLLVTCYAVSQLATWLLATQVSFSNRKQHNQRNREVCCVGCDLP